MELASIESLQDSNYKGHFQKKECYRNTFTEFMKLEKITSVNIVDNFFSEGG